MVCPPRLPARVCFFCLKRGFSPAPSSACTDMDLNILFILFVRMCVRCGASPCTAVGEGEGEGTSQVGRATRCGETCCLFTCVVYWTQYMAMCAVHRHISRPDSSHQSVQEFSIACFRGSQCHRLVKVHSTPADSAFGACAVDTECVSDRGLRIQSIHKADHCPSPAQMPHPAPQTATEATAAKGSRRSTTGCLTCRTL
jgi:hypothetical protein